MAEANLMEQIVALCKRRGFVYPASEIYGGLNGFWDYGPLGVLLKNNIRDWWWRNMVECPPIGPDGHPIEMVGIDTAIIQNPKTWVASGHAGGFSDPMVDCRACKSRFRADHLRFSEFSELSPQGATNEPVLIGGIGEPNEILEANRKKLDKLRRARPTLSNPFGWHQYSELRPEYRSRFECPECGEHGTLTEPRAFNLMFTTSVGALQSEESKAYLRPETAQGI